MPVPDAAARQAFFSTTVQRPEIASSLRWEGIQLGMGDEAFEHLRCSPEATSLPKPPNACGEAMLFVCPMAAWRSSRRWRSRPRAAPAAICRSYVARLPWRLCGS